MKRRSATSRARHTLAAEVGFWQSPHLIPPQGAMTVEELVAWLQHNRALRKDGKPAPTGWQDWLREHRNG